MREIPAVTIGHGGEDVVALLRGLESDLGDAREFFSQRVSVLRAGSADLVEINLLIKIQVRVRALPFTRETRVEKAGAIRFPGGASTGRRILHVLDRIGQSLPRGGLEEMESSVFTAAVRKRDGHEFPVA